MNTLMYVCFCLSQYHLLQEYPYFNKIAPCKNILVSTILLFARIFLFQRKLFVC